MAHHASQPPVVFGDAVVDRRLARWLAVKGLELENPQVLKTGGSGGKLVSAYLHVVRGRLPGGQRIIKLVGPSPDAEAEPENHLSALDLRVPGTEEFTERHLVKLDEARTWQLDDSWVMFQFPAGDGKEETDTLAELGRTPRLPELAARIVEGVLGGWNPGPSTGGRDKPPSAAEFVRELLGKRAEEDSGLRVWARARLGPIVDTEPWLALPGDSRSLPNPVLLGAGSALSGHDVRFAVRGHAHGDLHPGNIMVPVGENASPEDFWLIDLSRFARKALLARDPAHLLVCLIADLYLPHLSEDAREELLTALTGRDAACTGPLIPQGLAKTVTRVRQAWIDWGATPHLLINPGWRQQWFLALQACALMVAARERYSDADRWWFFRLAARACGAYVDTVTAQRPNAAPVPGPDTAVAAVPGPSGGTAAGRGAPAAAPVPRKPAGAPRRTSPPPAPAGKRFRGRRPGGGRTVLDVLTEIGTTFEHPRRQLSSKRLAPLKTMARSIRVRAVEFQLTLVNTPVTAGHPRAQREQAWVDEITGLLRAAEERAGRLARARERQGPYDDLALPQESAELGDLVKALDALLGRVGRARGELSDGSL
jgi:hypothetical protein